MAIERQEELDAGEIITDNAIGLRWSVARISYFVSHCKLLEGLILFLLLCNVPWHLGIEVLITI